MKKYNETEIRALATLAAEDYMKSCSGPTIRGRNGEKNLRGSSLQEVADKNCLTLDEAARLTVDLSTATFDELSPHWQKVNVDSAYGMIELMEAMGGAEVILGLNLDNPETRAQYGALLHNLWLQQSANSWARGGDLDKPFTELPKEEQDKDIQQLVSLQKWLRSMS